MVQRSSLTRLERLGSGGSGVAYAILGTDLVYKELNAKAQAIGAAAWAAGAVDFWRSLSEVDRAHLARLAVWPTDVVVDKGAVVGVIMPRIPADFWHTRPQIDGTPKSFDNAFKWLMQARANIAQGSLDVDAVTDPVVKIALLAQVVEAVAWLHARGVVFGDVSYGNFVFALHPPRALLLDCDAVATSPATNHALGRNTRSYQPPEHTPVPTTVTEATDVYKLGVLVMSALLPGAGATQRNPQHLPLLAGKIPPRLMDLLAAALSRDPATRPRAAELAGCLATLAARLTQPPVANMLRLEQEVVRRGGTARLQWDFDVASLITVELPDGSVLDLDHATHPKGCSFTATTSGPIAVHATNRYGTSTFLVGPVATYAPPAASLRLPSLGLPVLAPEQRGIQPVPRAPSAAATVPSAARLRPPRLPAAGVAQWETVQAGARTDAERLRAHLRRLTSR